MFDLTWQSGDWDFMVVTVINDDQTKAVKYLAENSLSLS